MFCPVGSNVSLLYQPTSTIQLCILLVGSRTKLGERIHLLFWDAPPSQQQYYGRMYNLVVTFTGRVSIATDIYIDVRHNPSNESMYMNICHEYKIYIYMIESSSKTLFRLEHIGFINLSYHSITIELHLDI